MKDLLCLPVLLSVLFLLVVFETPINAVPYFDDDDYGQSSENLSTNNNPLEELLFPLQKRFRLNYIFRRACIKRGGICDHRPNDCCSNSSCRCNLWGSNCRCQRAGLFQKWG